MSAESESKSQAAFVDDREIAKLIGVSRSWLQQRRAHGGGPPYYRVGARIVYSPPEVIAWVRSQPVGA